jgi:hypothetical protein
MNDLARNQNHQAFLQRLTDLAASGENIAALAADLTDPSRFTRVQARQLLAELPQDLQAMIVMASASELEVPNVALLPPDRVQEVIARDLVLHDHLSLLRADWQLLMEEEECTDRLRARFSFQVTDLLSGETRKVMVRLCPCRAFAYLSSIFASPEASWREETLEHMGPELLAFVLRAQSNGVLPVEEDLWYDFLEQASDTEIYPLACRMAIQDDLEALEESLLDTHHQLLATSLPDSLRLSPLRPVELSLDEGDFDPTDSEKPPREDIIDIELG